MSPAPSASPGRGTAPRRRNGRQQACEPCRKRKVACDHQMPVCSRCKSGENPSSCVYTKQVVSKGRSTRTSSTATLRRTGQPRRPTSDSTPLTPPTHKEGYLGVTSYKYAMCEAQLKMAPVPPPEDPPHQGNALELELSQSRIMCDDKTYEAAMRVLQAIPEKSLAYDLLKAHGNPNDGWCKLATLRLHDSLWNTFGSYLDSDRSPESLFQLAMKLYDNSFKPLHEDYTDPKEWLASFSGYNMRWEAIGILFTQWSFGAIAYHQGRPESSSHLSSDYAGQEGLESIITGDDSLQHLRLHGETMGLMTYLGLHMTGGELHDRGICTQIKRRLFGKIFHGDKVTSTFAGWPPMMSQRFISTLLPLDVSDEVLLGLSPWQDNIVDENGWNTLDEIYSSTLLRARAYLGFIRDSILDISLQVGGNTSRQELINLRDRQEEVLAKFPRCLPLEPGDADNRNISGPKLYAKLLIRLEYLQNVFFIERLINKADQVTLGTTLIQVSLEILSVTLTFWTHKDRMSDLHQDFEWLVIGYASPAAGILCLELLRPYADKIDEASATPGFSRSELIQKLSLLDGFLSWIKPLLPSRKLTCFISSVIQRVLDQTLNFPPRSPEPAVGIMGWGAEMGIDLNDFSFELLDTFDWMRPDGDD